MFASCFSKGWSSTACLDGLAASTNAAVVCSQAPPLISRTPAELVAAIRVNTLRQGTGMCGPAKHLLKCKLPVHFVKHIAHFVYKKVYPAVFASRSALVNKGYHIVITAH